MKLETYLETNKITYETFGERIGRTKAQVSKYCRQIHIPPPKVMKKITKVTKGEVAPASFYE